MDMMGCELVVLGEIVKGFILANGVFFSSLIELFDE